MITQTTEYALRAVVFLAQHPDESWTTQQIAGATMVPAGYLSKVLQGLSKHGIVLSQRGRRGGFQLAHDPNKLTVLQVVNAVDPVQRIRECPLHLKGHGANLCPLHKRLDDTIAMVEDSFNRTLVSDLLGKPDTPEPLCDFPREPTFAGRAPIRPTISVPSHVSPNPDTHPVGGGGNGQRP